MGSNASKAAKAASGAARRQYPSRVPPQPSPGQNVKASPQPAAGPTVHPKPHASGTRDEAINADAFDPQLNASLRTLGPVKPSPTYSNSSAAKFAPDQGGQHSGNQPVFPAPGNNPALQVLEARRKLAEEAEIEIAGYGKQSAKGKRFLDVMIIRQALRMRDEKGMPDASIERELGLQQGIIAKLGKKRIFREVVGTRSVGEGAIG